MKTMLHFVLLIGLIITVAACKKKRQTFPSNLAQLVVSVDAAQKDVLSFDSLCKAHLYDSTPIKSYTIRAADLLGALGMDPDLVNSDSCKFKHIRAYIGYQNGTGFKLFLVPVKGANIGGTDERSWTGGEDVPLDNNGNPIDAEERQLGVVENVLDLNAPCPNTCGKSILN